MNEITNSVNFLKQQKWVDLSHSIYGGIPYFQSFQPMQEKTLVTVAKDGFFAKEYQLVTQYGTHIDAPDYSLTVEDIKAFEAEYGEIPAESFVAFASGWSKRWEDTEAFYNVDQDGQAHTPGWSLEALKFLHEERNVTAVGHETLDTDSSVDCTKNGGLIGELYWLGQDKFQVEVLNRLTELPPVGGAISIGVPKVKDAPGFNVRAIAIVPAE